MVGSSSKQPAQEVARKPSDILTASGKFTPIANSAEVQEVAVRSALSQKVDIILIESDFRERPVMLYDLLQDASLQEVYELLALSDGDQNYSVGFRDAMKVAAYERWYELDTAAAIRAMDASVLSASQKNSRMETLLENWASRSPQDVIEFIQQGDLSGVSADLVYGAIVRGSAQQGDRSAVDFALGKIQDLKLRFYALKSAARVFQRDHADQFEDWLSTLPTEDQNVAIAESAWILADKDVEQALAGLASLDERDASQLPITRLRVVVKWADNDPVKAADWVAAQDVSSEDREILFANVMSVWASKDRGAAVAWANALIQKGKIDEAFMSRVAARM